MEHLSYPRETFLLPPVLFLFQVENHSIQLLETKENGVNGHSNALSEAEKACRHKKQNGPNTMNTSFLKGDQRNKKRKQYLINTIKQIYIYHLLKYIIMTLVNINEMLLKTLQYGREIVKSLCRKNLPYFGQLKNVIKELTEGSHKESILQSLLGWAMGEIEGEILHWKELAASFLKEYH